jgi:hypothetical protein
MKRPEICLLILVMIAAYALVACSPSGSAYGPGNCSPGGEVCINASTIQPINQGDPVRVTIKVTSSKDISKLHVILQTPFGVTTDGPQNWESNISDTSIQPTYASWGFAIKAGQTLTFNRVLHLPSSDGEYHIIIQAGSSSLLISDAFYILQMNGNINVYGAGTPLPTTKYQVDVITSFPTIGLSPTFPSMITILPSAHTPFPTLVTNPTPTQFVPLVATSTHTPYPGPTSYP